MKLWHYTKMGLQQGPVPEEELRQKIRRAEIGPTTLVWHDGMADWMPLEKVAELREDPVPEQPVWPTPAPAAPPQSMEGGGHIPLPQPPAFDGNYMAPVIPNYLWQSVVALMLSAGMMMLVCLPIGMPFAIVALVYASKVEGLRVQQRFIEAASASKSAKLWMIISYALSGLVIVGLVGIFAFALMGGGFSP